MAKHDNKLISHSHPKTSWPGAYAAVCAIIIAIVINGVGNAEPYDDGVAANKRGDYETAVQLFRPLAEQGHAKAQAYLGLMYAKGDGVTQDYDEEVKWFRLAAEQGIAFAQYDLGISYSEGNGVNQDFAEAVNWYRRAAEQGYVKAEVALAEAYDRGLGVKQDNAEAALWYHKAAEQGDADAQYALGNMYFFANGVPEDESEALQWYRKAADQGLASAQFSVGDILEHSEKLSRDLGEAARWYQLAAEQGDADAEFALGKLYRVGRGVPQNDELAYKWFGRTAVNADGSHKNHALSELNSLAAKVPALDAHPPPDPFGRNSEWRWNFWIPGAITWLLLVIVSGVILFISKKRSATTVPNQSAVRSLPQKIEALFWIFYLLFPILSGYWQAYDWLPHESYTFGSHTLVASHEVCDDTRCGDVADMWKDKETGEFYTREDFADHRHSEALRMAVTWFVYGVIGCFAFAYFRDLKSPGTFSKYLRGALCVNAAIAAFELIHIWHVP